MTAEEAHRIGMINRVVTRDALEEETAQLAARIATMPRFGLALTKMAINQAEDRMGLRDTMAATYGLHHLCLFIKLHARESWSRVALSSHFRVMWYK